MNETIITGRMTKDPTLRETASGKPVMSFTVAIDRPFLNADGIRETDFVPVVIFGQAAKIVATYGYHNWVILVKGRLQNKNYEDKNGIKHNDLELIGNLIEFPNIKTPAKRNEDKTSPVEQEIKEELPTISAKSEDVPFDLSSVWDGTSIG